MNRIHLFTLMMVMGAALTCTESKAQQPGGTSNATNKSRVFFYPDQQTATTLFQSGLIFSPNPASALVQVHVTGVRDHVLGNGYELKVYNQAGLLVQQGEWAGGQKLDVSRFPTGVYVVVIKKENELYSQKLVVRR